MRFRGPQALTDTSVIWEKSQEASIIVCAGYFFVRLGEPSDAY